VVFPEIAETETILAVSYIPRTRVMCHTLIDQGPAMRSIEPAGPPSLPDKILKSTISTMKTTTTTRFGAGSHRVGLSTALALFTSLVLPASAATIAISNHSFEAPGLAEGAISTTTTGWTFFTAGDGSQGRAIFKGHQRI
jgi:hypothetical protein